MLHVESTRAAADRVFVDRGSVIVFARSTEWPQAARDALRTLVDPVWTKGHLGMRWVNTQAGAETLSQLEGLESVAVAERGRLLFLANDPAFLRAVLGRLSTSEVDFQGSYAAGFRHTLERGRFVSTMRFIDHADAQAENHAPLFFSENVASLSDAFSQVDSASIVVRDQGARVSETVTYRLTR